MSLGDLDPAEAADAAADRARMIRVVIRVLVVGLAGMAAIFVGLGLVGHVDRKKSEDGAAVASSGAVATVESSRDYSEARLVWQAINRKDHEGLRRFLGGKRDEGTASDIELLALASLEQDAGELVGARKAIQMAEQRGGFKDGQSLVVIGRQHFLEGDRGRAGEKLAEAIALQPSLLRAEEGRSRALILGMIVVMLREGRHEVVDALLPDSELARDPTLHPMAIEAAMGLGKKERVIRLLQAENSPLQGIARLRALASAHDLFGETELAAPLWERALMEADRARNWDELRLIGTTALARMRLDVARTAYGRVLDLAPRGGVAAEDVGRYSWALLRAPNVLRQRERLERLRDDYPDVTYPRLALQYLDAMEGRSPQTSIDAPAGGSWRGIGLAAQSWSLLATDPGSVLTLARGAGADAGGDEPALAVVVASAYAATGDLTRARAVSSRLERVPLSDPERNLLSTYVR